MKLKTKIHLFSTLLMLIILTLTNVGIYFLFEKMAYDSEYNQLDQQTKDITKSFSKMTVQNDPRTVMSAYMPPSGAIRIFDSTGKKIEALETVGEIKNFKPKFNQDVRYSIESFEGIPVLSIRSPVIWTNGEVVELQMIQLLTDAKHSLTTLILVLMGVTLVAMIPITVSSIMLGRILTRPIEQLIATMSRSRKSGTYEKINIPSTEKTKWRKWARTFNEMMSQLEKIIISRSSLYQMLPMN